MVHKYSKIPQNPEKSCRARASGVREHFKPTREAAYTLRGMKLTRAKQFLANVLAHKEIVPFRRYRYGISRHAQLHQHKRATQGGWPSGACNALIDVLKCAESNAEVRQLDTERLVIKHIQVNKAPQGRRRTFRAHGRITAFKSSPCHIEVILTEKPQKVKKGVKH